MSEDGSEEETASASALVLDFLPHGRSDDDRPQYQKPPLAHAIDVETFQLYEFVLPDDTDVTIGDTISVAPQADGIDEIRDIEYDDLSGGARSELEHAVVDIVERNEQRFVDFYNDAQPITLRLHQLTLLPGIGDKLRDNILEARERDPFDGFDDLGDRISGLHDPEGVIVDRILEEIRDEDIKYKLFARER